jgi:beta-catenin-like protein 1
MLGKGNGVDTLLVCLAGFKSKEPADDLEQETMENIFDTLCSCLLLPSNRWGWGQESALRLMGKHLFCVVMFWLTAASI